ncbi:unnamed protein product [Gordionus sp. m RMFG-2023]
MMFHSKSHGTSFFFLFFLFLDDYNRVKLKPYATNPDGYINASFIDGYRKEKYIATQGPNVFSMNDFWAMIWQKRCSKIIMLTNLIEQGQNKCDKYWPDDVDIYGSIKVSRVITKTVADYTLCDFGLTNVETYETKIIRHFRFTAWPDHGVPANPTELLGFYHVIQQHQSALSGPIAIHCSAGVGRTGTYIALEAMIEMAREMGQIDIYGFCKEMRQQRICMLQTPEQYTFLHEALVEALQIGKTFVACSNWADYYLEMEKNLENGKNGVHTQWEIICKIAPPNKIIFDSSNQGFNPMNIKKNRDPKVVPAEIKRPKLKILGDGRDGFLSDYINAVFVNGFKVNDAYIVTQHPFPSTIVDFWKLVYDYNVYSIVMLNQIDKNSQTVTPYWPQEGTALYASLEVKMLDTSAVVTKKYKKSLTIRKLSLANLLKPSEKKRIIKQFHVSSWTNNERVPSCTIPLLETLERSYEWNEENKAKYILVHDLDGYTRSGIFCVCARLWDQMRIERGLNIYLSVRSVRASRPQFIKEYDDYEFLYKFTADCVDAYDSWKHEIEDIHYIEHYMPAPE